MNQTPNTSSSKNKKFKLWLKKHWLSLTIIVCATLIAGIFIYALSGIQSDGNATILGKKKAPPEKIYSNLTGLEVESEASKNAPVTAVMIENSPDARPQSGLKKAGAVYEAVAEGGITRFIAIYQHDKPELIGPVRSLRIYYLDWAAPYKATIAHVGGSSNALSTVQNGNYRDGDQFYNAGTYWRAPDRYAPHNVYTSGAKLDEFNTSKGYSESIFESFKRTDGKPAEVPDASSISIEFSSAIYSTAYSYDAQSNSYLRSLAGQPHLDREDGQINPKVVVAIKVGSQLRAGPDGYEDIVTEGSGQAYVFQNGTVEEVTWRKDGRDSPLQLANSEGKAVSLNRGQTWIAAVTDRGSVSWQ